MKRRYAPPLKPHRVTGCWMSVKSRTTMPWIPLSVTRAGWWRAGPCELKTSATGAGGVGPPGVGLGKGIGDPLATGVFAADGDVFDCVGLLPHATASNIRATRTRLTSPAILTHSPYLSACQQAKHCDPEQRAGRDHDAPVQRPVPRPGFTQAGEPPPGAEHKRPVDGQAGAGVPSQREERYPARARGRDLQRRGRAKTQRCPPDNLRGHEPQQRGYANEEESSETH